MASATPSRTAAQPSPTLYKAPGGSICARARRASTSRHATGGARRLIGSQTKAAVVPALTRTACAFPSTCAKPADDSDASATTITASAAGERERVRRRRSLAARRGRRQVGDADVLEPRRAAISRRAGRLGREQVLNVVNPRWTPLAGGAATGDLARGGGGGARRDGHGDVAERARARAVRERHFLFLAGFAFCFFGDENANNFLFQAEKKSFCGILDYACVEPLFFVAKNGRRAKNRASKPRSVSAGQRSDIGTPADGPASPRDAARATSPPRTRARRPRLRTRARRPPRPSQARRPTSPGPSGRVVGTEAARAS